MEDDSSALSQLKAATEREPGNPGNWILYGNLLSGQGSTEEAVRAMEKALELSPGGFDTRYYLACELATAGRHNEAIKHFWSLCGDDPKLENPLSVYGLSALQGMVESMGALGHWPEAADAFRPAVKLAAKIFGQFAFLAQKNGDHSDAALFFTLGLFALPHDAELLYGAGFNNMKIGQLESALKYLEMAVKADPNSPPIRYDLGITLSRMGRRREARGAFEKALRLDPGFFWAYYDLGCLDALEGNPDEAFGNLNRAVDGGFRDAAHLTNDTDLCALRDDPRWEMVLRRIEGGSH